MVYNFFDKKTSAETVKNEVFSNTYLAEELHKTFIRKFEKRKVQSPFTDNIWGAGLANVKLISKSHKGFKILLSVIDIYSKYTWIISLKDKKNTIITNAFQKILHESNGKRQWIL